MADISKCEGRDCPIKHKCYRFTAPSGELVQSWMEFWNDEKVKEGECDDFWLEFKRRD